MKLFLSSAGLTKPTLVNALNNLVGLPVDQIKVSFIPTAANFEEGDKGWLIDDLHTLKSLNYFVDLVDISALSQDVWLPRLKSANVIFVGGGNTLHLMHWVEKSGLKDLLPELLKTRVYAGISAGSCIAGPTIYNSVQNLFAEKYDLKIDKGMSLVEFQIVPHLNSQWFPQINLKNLELSATDIKEPVYALDDSSAIVIDQDKLEVISEGVWKKLN